MNEEAGRGGGLILPIRLDNGEEVLCLIDTGSTGTVLDKAFESRLGPVLCKARTQSWGKVTEHNVYASPKLYLGGVALETGPDIMTQDFADTSEQSGRRVMGMIGMDVLRHYCIQLDFAAREVRFLDQRAGKRDWGKAYSITDLHFRDARPSVRGNLSGAKDPQSLIDTGCTFDGWLIPKWYQQWTNHARVSANGVVRPSAVFDGKAYPRVDLLQIGVESDGIGLRFLARHLVTLDFPKQKLYLRQQSAGPIPSQAIKFSQMAALSPLIEAVVADDQASARSEFARLEQSDATSLEKLVARKLIDSLEDKPKPAPADVSTEVEEMALGDARPESAEVGWLQPTANRIPLNDEIESPLLNSGKIYATGLYAHAPSRYVYKLDGKWKNLRGTAGLHTVFQHYEAVGVVFCIKADGKEVFRSAVIRGTDQANYDIDLTHAKTLELVVEKAGESLGGQWGLWLDPILSRARQ